mmetsp:Transcript_5859/g.12212  ORF Transcript_5859/g.12212 Transcript_5859/m.12212 type:complete len:296 (+) Transcript_5859:1161-2048(+)
MPAGAAGDDQDATSPAQGAHGGLDIQAALHLILEHMLVLDPPKPDVILSHLPIHSRLLVKPPTHAIAKGVGLVVDFLQHEILVPSLLNLLQLHLDLEGRSVPRVGAALGQGGDGGLLASAQHHHVVVLQVDHLLSMLHNGRSIGGNNELRIPLPNTHNHRATTSTADQDVVALRASKGEDHPEGALHVLHRADHTVLHRVLRVGVALALNQVHNHLCVRVAAELHPGLLELALHHVVIGHNAIMDDGDGAVCGEVRVSVGVARPAVGGPSGVGNAEGALEGLGGLEIRHLASFLQ